MPDTIEIKKTGEQPGEAHLAVTVPVDRVREVEEAATRSYQSRARLPGFRKGKAPTAIIRKQFAADIRESTLRELVQRSWQVALEQEQLKPIADPHIHDLKWEEGTPLTFTFHVEVRPDIKLQRLGGFTVQRKVTPVTEDQVQAQLQALREQRAPWTPVSGEPPKPKDMVKVTLGQREGDEVKNAEPYQIVLGQGQAIPDVEERILALKPEETVDATVRFPDDFPDADKRGASRDVRITLHEVKRQQLPELSDEFAREVGDFDSLEVLRTAIRADLQKEAEREAEARVRSELIAQVIAANAVTAPRPLVERVIATYGQAYGIPEDRFPQFATEFRPLAEQQVQRDLVLDWIVEHQKLAATEKEIDARVAELAERRKVPPAEVYASLEKNKRLRDLERGLTEEKVFTFLLSQSTVESA